MEENSTQEFFTEIITKYLSGEASKEEIQKLNKWIESDAANCALYTELKTTWENIEKYSIQISTDLDTEWAKMEKRMSLAGDEQEDGAKIIRMDTAEKKGGFMKYLRLAAALLALAVIGSLTYYFVSKPSEQTLIAQTTMTEKTLPDGTVVTLNAHSTLSYPEKFEEKSRNVTLKGEAYFNVAPDKEKPFIINACDVEIKVVGTSFYVNTNAETCDVEVVVTSGKVAVYNKNNPGEIIYLEPGEKASIPGAQPEIVKTVNDDANYIAWKTKKMIFDNMELSEIIRSVNKVYNTDIALKSENIKGCRVTAAFDNQPLNAVLKVLQATLDLKIDSTGSAIGISGQGCK